ncbi:MAG: FtsW/RodA/SpoVE family cell cycle protein [Bacillota bacterium]|nr:FtsW/RodA/SpoVE family cell cycle protein [Bacillota bacterium]
MFRQILKGFDYLLMLLVIVIFAIGMVTIASATGYDLYGITREVKFQFIGFLIGIIFMMVLLFIDYKFWGYLHWVIYAASLGLLLILYIPGVGVVRGGAMSWIDLGVFDFQTSEISKLGYILFLSKFIEKKGGINSFLDALIAGSTSLPLIYLLLKQPDLGTALVFVFITIGILFAGGIKYWHMLLVGSLFAVTAPIFYNKLGQYQKDRLLAFVSQDDLTLPGNYHVLMSKISIGSGGYTGKGLFAGEFHRLNYLPVKESDFIFAVFVEEWGYYGGMLLISLFVLLLLRLLYIAVNVKDMFASNIVVGVLFLFGFQILENIGMTMGAMPVTGLTLPFFSAGPTSLVSSLLAVGLVHSCNIYRVQKKTSVEFEKVY